MANAGDLRSEAETRAGDLRHRCSLGYGPVDVFAAIRNVGIELVRYPAPEGTIEGIYRPGDDAAFILVNSRASLPRQRFTAAHELGHHLLHAGTTFVEGTLNDDTAEERQAQWFAGAFLVDRLGALELLSKAKALSVDEKIAQVSHAFLVSPEAAAIQLVRYNAITQEECNAFRAEYFQAGGNPNSLYRRFSLTRRQLAGHAERELDAAFRSRAVAMYAVGQLSLERLADVLRVDQRHAAALVADLGHGATEPMLAWDDEPIRDA